jgi:hypothetical protein
MIQSIVEVVEEFLYIQTLHLMYNDLFIKSLPKQEYQEMNNVFIEKQLKNDTQKKEKYIDEMICETDSTLYRKIARKIHPDKAKINYGTLFQNVTNAYKNKKMSLLIYYARKCQIDYEVNQRFHKQILSEIDTMKTQIKTLKETVAWKWYHANEIERQNIIKSIKGTICF